MDLNPGRHAQVVYGHQEAIAHVAPRIVKADAYRDRADEGCGNSLRRCMALSGVYPLEIPRHIKFTSPGTVRPTQRHMAMAVTTDLMHIYVYTVCTYELWRASSRTV